MTFTLASTQRNPKLVAVRLIGKKSNFWDKKQKWRNATFAKFFASHFRPHEMKILVYTFRLSCLVEVVWGPTYMAIFKIVAIFYHFNHSCNSTQSFTDTDCLIQVPVIWVGSAVNFICEKNALLIWSDWLNAISYRVRVVVSYNIIKPKLTY